MNMQQQNSCHPRESVPRGTILASSKIKASKESQIGDPGAPVDMDSRFRGNDSMRIRGDDKQKIFQHLNCNHGMLLLEAILAIVILTISLTVIIESLVSGLRATVFTVDYSKAIILTDNVMADILRQREVDPSLANKVDFSEPNDAFQYAITTQDIQEEATQSPFKEVQVEVSWKSGQKEQGLSVATWVPNVSQDN